MEYMNISFIMFDIFNDFDESIIVFTDINDDTYQYKIFKPEKFIFDHTKEE